MTEKLMLEEGYAAVTTRRVAKEVGVTAALVHYHFPTTDDLLLALFQTLKDSFKGELEDSVGERDPLRALWSLNSDPVRTRIIIEFMALSNHRKAIRKQIADYIDHVRTIQAKALASVMPLPGEGRPGVSPLAASVLVAGMARSIVMEEELGVSMGHDEARALVDMMIRFVTGGAVDPTA